MLLNEEQRHRQRSYMMEDRRFDDLTKRLGQGTSRRQVLK
jgi:hypothetical protein